MGSFTTILLVRHGETDWNRDGRIMGELPIPLNNTGQTQSSLLASFLRGYAIDAIYSSPARRAEQTANILAERLRRSVEINEGLTEIGMGDWQGRYWKDLADDLNRRQLYTHPDEARPPGGESLREVQSRSIGVIEQALRRQSEATLIFVTHADVVRAVVAHYLRFELGHIKQVRVDHASLTALELKSGRADLLYLNYVPTTLSAEL